LADRDRGRRNNSSKSGKTNNGIIGNKIIIGSQGILQRMGGKGRNPRIELGIIERSHQGVRVERAIGSPLCYQASYS